MDPSLLFLAWVAAISCLSCCNDWFPDAGERFVTFDGIAKACAEAMGKPEPELIHFNPKDFDFGKKKSFPMRDQHFFASIDKAEKLLGWRPKYGLVDGLRDSYQLVHFSSSCSF